MSFVVSALMSRESRWLEVNDTSLLFISVVLRLIGSTPPYSCSFHLCPDTENEKSATSLSSENPTSVGIHCERMAAGERIFFF